VLQDGIFSKQKSKFWYILQGLVMEDFGILYGHLVNFTNVWYIALPFGIFYGYLVYVFFPFWYFVPRKIWQPALSAVFTAIFFPKLKSA
jgi:hypothetical protein